MFYSCLLAALRHTVTVFCARFTKSAKTQVHHLTAIRPTAPNKPYGSCSTPRSTYILACNQQTEGIFDWQVGGSRGSRACPKVTSASINISLMARVVPQVLNTHPPPAAFILNFFILKLVLVCGSLVILTRAHTTSGPRPCLHSGGFTHVCTFQSGVREAHLQTSHTLCLSSTGFCFFTSQRLNGFLSKLHKLCCMYSYSTVSDGSTGFVFLRGKKTQ